jgi:hypothetical protein
LLYFEAKNMVLGGTCPHYLQYMWVLEHFFATASQAVVALMMAVTRFQQQQF